MHVLLVATQLLFFNNLSCTMRIISFIETCISTAGGVAATGQVMESLIEPDPLLIARGRCNIEEMCLHCQQNGIAIRFPVWVG